MVVYAIEQMGSVEIICESQAVCEPVDGALFEVAANSIRFGKDDGTLEDHQVLTLVRDLLGEQGDGSMSIFVTKEGTEACGEGTVAFQCVDHDSASTGSADGVPEPGHMRRKLCSGMHGGLPEWQRLARILFRHLQEQQYSRWRCCGAAEKRRN